MLNIIINIDFNYIHLATPTNLGVKGIVQIKGLEGYAQRLLGEAQLRTFRAADFSSSRGYSCAVRYGTVHVYLGPIVWLYGTVPWISTVEYKYKPG